MLKNYFKIDENETVKTFLKDLNEKKNMQYIILETSPKTFVDIRTITLGIHNSNVKLKTLKKPISWINAKTKEDKLNFLIDSGDRIIETQEGYYDFIDALKQIKESDFNFLDLKIKDKLIRSQVFALTQNDKISTARNFFIKKRVNILPVLDVLKVIGEVRTMDLLLTNLVDSSKDRSLYSNNSNSSDSTYNLPIENIINKRPITINNTSFFKDALDTMINKKLPSIIILDGDSDNLFTVISYKDIFKFVKKDLEKNNYNIEYIGSTNIYDDEFDLIQDYCEKTMKKISKLANYDNLKVSFKLHGNIENSHQRKIAVNLLLSHGNHIIHVDKEILGGTSDEEHNNKVKGTWNTPQTLQDALNILEKQVKEEIRKNKR